VEAALSARVRSATESSRLSERRRNTSAESASGLTTASRSLRQAASAVARASSSHRSCGRCRSRAPALALKAWTAHPPPTRRLLCQPRCQVSAEAASVLHRPERRSGNRFAQRSRILKPARFCGKLAHSMSSPATSSTTATARVALWGSTPMKTFMPTRTSVSVESLPLWGVKDMPTLGCALSYLF
jgi:hypothetical protein